MVTCRQAEHQQHQESVRRAEEGFTCKRREGAAWWAGGPVWRASPSSQTQGPATGRKESWTHKDFCSSANGSPRFSDRPKNQAAVVSREVIFHQECIYMLTTVPICYSVTLFFQPLHTAAEGQTHFLLGCVCVWGGGVGGGCCTTKNILLTEDAWAVVVTGQTHLAVEGSLSSVHANVKLCLDWRHRLAYKCTNCVNIFISVLHMMVLIRFTRKISTFFASNLNFFGDASPPYHWKVEKGWCGRYLILLPHALAFFMMLWIQNDAHKMVYFLESAGYDTACTA